MFNLGAIEEYVASHLKLVILSVTGLLILMGVIAVSIFFMALQGAEQTMVPDVRGRELTEALLELQVKELYPRLQLRYSQNAGDRGLVLEQDPKPGAITKAGRRIRLVVSQGVVVNRVENFVSRNIDSVRVDLQTIYAPSGSLPLLTLKEPLMYEFSGEPAGTVLAQKPVPGTDISGPLTLELVVSRGSANAVVTVPQLTGLGISEALEVIGATGINFEFSLGEGSGGERGETVISQRPAADSTVPANTVVQLTVTAPQRLADGEIFDLFRYMIHTNPYPLAVRLEALLPSGERLRLFTVDYLGGEFTVPYRLPEGTTLVLYMQNREIYRSTVPGGQAEAALLRPDQALRPEEEQAAALQAAALPPQAGTAGLSAL